MNAAITSDDQAAAAIARVGALDLALAAIETAKAEAVAKAAVAAETAATPHIEERGSLVAALRGYAERERRRLTDDFRTKTVAFPTGELAWREAPGRVVVEPKEKPKILARLKALGKEGRAFLRVSEAIDASAVRAAFRSDKGPPDFLKRMRGLSFEKEGEDFAVRPAGAALAERPQAA